MFLGTASDNNADMMKKGRHNTKNGEETSNAFLNENQVAEIKFKLKNGSRTIDLAREYQIGEVAIYSIKSGKTWKHVESI